MTKVLINGRFLCRQPTGVDRFATELLRIIDEWYESESREVEGVDCEILVPRLPLMYWQPCHIPVVKAPRFSGHAWEQITLARHRDHDVLVSLCNTGPLAAANHIVAIHDATPVRVPESFSRTFRTVYKGLMPAIGCASRRVLTVSNFSAAEIAACYRINRQKIEVIGNSGEHVSRIASDESTLDRLSLRGKSYALAVATNAKHKNISILSDVAERLRADNMPIVLVGGANNKVFDEFSAESADAVIRAGFVSDGELRALYEHATCFVFPSIYEGFGIPPLEAMHLGCPVISSDTSAMPEVLGDAAVYVSPHDSEGFYRAIRHVADDSDQRNLLRERGYRQAAKYSWETSARRLLSVCHEVAGKDDSI